MIQQTSFFFLLPLGIIPLGPIIREKKIIPNHNHLRPHFPSSPPLSNDSLFSPSSIPLCTPTPPSSLTSPNPRRTRTKCVIPRSTGRPGGGGERGGRGERKRGRWPSYTNKISNSRFRRSWENNHLPHCWCMSVFVPFTQIRQRIECTHTTHEVFCSKSPPGGFCSAGKAGGRPGVFGRGLNMYVPLPSRNLKKTAAQNG